MRWYIIFSPHSGQIFCHKNKMWAVDSGKFTDAETAVFKTSMNHYISKENLIAVLGRFSYHNDKISGVIFGSARFFDLTYRGKTIASNVASCAIQKVRDQMAKTGFYKKNELKFLPRG